MADHRHGGASFNPSGVGQGDYNEISFRRRSRQSYETGESSRTGSLIGSNTISDLMNTGGLQDGYQGDQKLGEHRQQQPTASTRDRRKRRQSSNAFLLHDAVASVTDRGYHRTARPISHVSKGKAANEGVDNRLPSSTTTRTYRSSNDCHARSSEEQSSRPTTNDGSPGHSTHLRPNQDAQPQQSVDADATQIVNMALNLSESRRIASTRRTASRTNPPALAPLPDPASGSSLRQHLQQQRKTSRGASPRASSPRTPYDVPRTGSPLNGAPFEPPGAGHDSSYRWHFTPSTLSRAQKAREQLELMAEYRRLLTLMPPIGAGPDVTSPPRTPANGVSAVDFRKRGSGASESRPYNPLQYIRNRKVRARERMVIDGEAQGFNDVDAVRTWVDALANQSSSSSTLASGAAAKAQHLPTFSGVEEQQTSPDVGSRAARSRRPRVDWFFDPCDMIADVYWTEQKHHKHLIEDRHWRKIVPGGPEPTRPVTMSTEDGSIGASSLGAAKTLEDTMQQEHTHDSGLTPERPDEELNQMKTREKARQKLHDWVPHRHHADPHKGHDFLGLKKKGSMSDLSDSDDDIKDADGQRAARHRPRRPTISSDTNDLLQKQMLEILAKEAQERQLADLPETAVEHDNEAASSELHNLSSREHSRKGSVVADQEAWKHNHYQGAGFASPPQHRSGRPSLEIPQKLRRYSTDDDSSVPVSPREERPMVMTLGSSAISPPGSRSGSPQRARLAKSATHGPLQLHDVKERDEEGSMTSPKDPSSPGQDEEKRQTSPARRLATVNSYESYRGHRHSSSKDTNVVLRGIFKGPSALRGGVSKLGDFLWKKDGSSEIPDVGESTDESDAEPNRGRRRPTLSRHNSRRGEHKRQTSKHFLDGMPVFTHAADAPRRASTTEVNIGGLATSPQATIGHSRQSSRFDLLKPPKFDLGRQSNVSLSPPQARGVGESSASENEVTGKKMNATSEAAKNAADRRLSGIMGLPPLAHDRSLSLTQTDTASTQQTYDSSSTFMPRTKLSRAELARMRALILSSGIKALEITRRAEERNHPLDEALYVGHNLSVTPIQFAEIAKLSPEPGELQKGTFPCCDLYNVAAKHLGNSISTSTSRCHHALHSFSTTTTPLLHRRLGTLRSRVADDLSSATRLAADLADETGKDLALSQPLKVRHVEDLVGRLARRRGRRFRWVRRAVWVGVEWTVVGFMWWVWLMVVVSRLVYGVGKGVAGGLRWLFWLDG